MKIGSFEMLGMIMFIVFIVGMTILSGIALGMALD